MYASAEAASDLPLALAAACATGRRSSRANTAHGARGGEDDSLSAVIAAAKATQTLKANTALARTATTRDVKNNERDAEPGAVTFVAKHEPRARWRHQIAHECSAAFSSYKPTLGNHARPSLGKS
jgi:hypothetical protein